MRIATRLWGGVAFVVIGVVVFAGSIVLGANRASSLGDEVFRTGRIAKDVGDLLLAFERIDALTQQAPAEMELDRLAQLRKASTDQVGQFDQNLRALAERVADDAGLSAKLSAVTAARDVYVEETGKVFGKAEFFLQHEAVAILQGPFAQAQAAVRENLTAATETCSTAKSEAHAGDLRAALDTVLEIVLVGAVAFFGLAVLAGLTLSRRVIAPITGMTTAMERLADGDHGITIPSVGSHDEVGTMARAVQVFKENMIRGAQMAAEQVREQTNRPRPQPPHRGTGRGLPDDGGGSGRSGVRQCRTYRRTSCSDGERSWADWQPVHRRARGGRAHGAERPETVAAATEELSSSILEIGRQAETSAEVAAEAVSESRDTTGIVKGLSNED